MCFNDIVSGVFKFVGVEKILRNRFTQKYNHSLFLVPNNLSCSNRTHLSSFFLNTEYTTPSTTLCTIRRLSNIPTLSLNPNTTFSDILKTKFSN